MMKKLIYGILFILLCVGLFVAATQWQNYSSLTTIATGDDWLVRDVSDTTMDADGTIKRLSWSNFKASLDALYQPLEATLSDIADGTIAENLVNTANPWADNEVSDTLTVTGYMQDGDINTFSELQSWVSDKTLLNEEDVFTLDGNWVNTANPWAVNEGGSGAATFTDGGILLGSGTGAFTALGAASNGQIPIGDGTTDPVLANITETGDALTVTNGAGTIDLAVHANVERLADSPVVGTDPDVDAAGELGRDSDGANETGDSSLRGYDGANQFSYARKLKCMHVTLADPSNLLSRDLTPIWSNETGMTFTITKIESWSDDDDVGYTLNEYAPTNFSSATTIDAVTVATDGTGVYYDTQTSITAAAIEANNVIAIDFDDTDAPDYLKISVCGWLNADVD